LPLDDSKGLVVTSFNEGFVPKSTGADAFLPDRLRKELNLEHNERRYARDAYATAVLCHSRQELRVIFARMARRDAQDNPLQPSRLIFACPDADLVRRAQRYFAERKPPTGPRRLLLARREPILEKSLFAPPRPVSPKERLKQISVTRFKEYLACPYRYYLRHVEKLEAVDDTAREMDGGVFGTLLHGALGAFGRDAGAPNQSTREQEIFDFANERLNAIASLLFGPEAHRPSIRLQLEQARLRLRAFARQQAALAAEGWRIIHVESAEDKRVQLSVSFPVDGEEILLVGRIDRIDFHETKRTLRILDYKTADTAQTPDKTHRKKDAWIDLQLPLYRYLWPAAGLSVPGKPEVELGYFNLPKKVDGAGVAIADWDNKTLESARVEAQRIIGELRKKVYLPWADPPPPYSDDLAAICMDNVRGRPRPINGIAGGEQ
jgi:ATP-dependent helicase/nuclease subunit B